MTTNHRLTWRGRCAVIIEADSREQAIERAIKGTPDHFPPGTQLYYGLAGSGIGSVYTIPDKADALGING